MAGEKFFVREFEIRLTEIVLESARLARFSDSPKGARHHEKCLHEARRMLRLVMQDAVGAIGRKAAKDALKAAVENLQDALIITEDSLALVKAASEEAQA